jgi:hypothetical protein
MVGSIDPRCETVRGTHWPKKVVWLFGARVAETILASGLKHTASTGRTYGCKRSDQTLKNSCGTGAVHIWVPAFAGTTHGGGVRSHSASRDVLNVSNSRIDRNTASRSRGAMRPSDAQIFRPNESVLASARARRSADLEYAQDTVRSIGVIVGEEPCCISPTILKPWRS